MTITSSVIERTTDMALFAESSCARLTDVTIRDVAGLDPDPDDPQASCLGNGIRVRFNRPAGVPPECAAGGAPAVVSHSLIEHTREAAVHCEPR